MKMTIIHHHEGCIWARPMSALLMYCVPTLKCTIQSVLQFTPVQSKLHGPKLCSLDFTGLNCNTQSALHSAHECTWVLHSERILFFGISAQHLDTLYYQCTLRHFAPHDITLHCSACTTTSDNWQCSKLHCTESHFHYILSVEHTHCSPQQLVAEKVILNSTFCTSFIAMNCNALCPDSPLSVWWRANILDI